MSNTNNSLVQDNSLLRKFEEIHDFIYANDGLSPQQTLNEILKILFVKIYDEKNEMGQFYISGGEFREILSSKQEVPVTRRISNLFSYTKAEFSDVFDPEEKIGLSPSSLGFTVNKLQSISLKDSPNDAKGLAFQKFLSHGEKIGKGQFFTPQPVIDFCVDIIDPQPNEKIIDPCCGSGGFINSAFRYMSKGSGMAERQSVISNNIFGIDINKDITKISKMKFLLEENIKSNIYCNNSLGDIDTLKLLLFGNSHEKDGFDVLLTNPPFGATGKITDKSILSSFELGYKWKEYNGEFVKTDELVSGQPAEILFIERCLDLLKEGGRMAIVLPNGHFENPSLEYLRFYIKQRSKLLAIINLPQETFIPYGTGVKTSILFLKKDTKNAEKEYPLFFSKILKLGYQGNKNASAVYKKDNHGTPIYNNGSLVIDENFTDVVNDYKAFIAGDKLTSDISFVTDYKELHGRFDYDFYSPANRGILSRLEQSSVRLGDIVDIIKTRSPKLKNKETEVDYVELSDINTHSFEIINSTRYFVHELPSRATYELKEGDIITGIAGNSVGTKKHATALVSSKFNGAICTNGFRILRNPEINPYYLLFYLHTDLFLKQMAMYRTGAAIPNVSDADLANVLVYLPDLDTVDLIGEKVKKSFEMRRESQKMLENIEL